MALSTAGLKAAIIAEFQTQYGAATDAAERAKFSEAVATAVINYLTANTVVNPGTLAASSGIVTSCGAGAGATTAPGPLSGTGTVS